MFGAMLIMFLDTTTPKRAFYNNAVRSYGFLDDSKNLHGLLELESESLKNLALAQIKDNRHLMFLSAHRIWHEDMLNELRETLNRSREEYWEKAGENVIKGVWKTANEARSKSSSYDKTRKMYQGAFGIERLQTWSYFKDLEEEVMKDILALSFDTTKKTPANIIEQLEKLCQLSSRSSFDEEHKSTEIKEIQKILSDVLGNKYAQWREGVQKLKNEMEYGKKYRGIMTKLKPPQEERLAELVSLKKIEQNLFGKTNIDSSTWQGIKELLNIEESLEKSLPQVDQDKKNFLNELEQKSLSSNGQTQPQTFEEVSRIKDEISKIFQNSIKDALKQRNPENNGPQGNALLKQLEEDIIGLTQDQSGLSSNRSTSLLLEEKLSDNLQDILHPINKNLVDKLQNLATAYNNRISDENYKALRRLARSNFQETLTLGGDKNRLQSVFAMIETVGPFGWSLNVSDYKKNFNVENTVNVHVLDNKLPLTMKFKGEVAEVIKLIFQNHGIDEMKIAPFLDDLMLIIGGLYVYDELYKPKSEEEKEKESSWWQKIKGAFVGFIGMTVEFASTTVEAGKEFLSDIFRLKYDSMRPDKTEFQPLHPPRYFTPELQYFTMVIEDFRDTKRNLDVSIFKEFSSWKEIFKDNKDPNIENSILYNFGNSLTFARGIDSINFYAANKYVRQALVCTLPLRSEVSDQQKEEADLPTSKDPAVIRQEIREIFDYGLQEGNNDQVKLQENKETIRRILTLLHEAKLANFPENQNEEIDVFSSYSKAMVIVVSVWDKDYGVPLRRTTNYHCRIEYAENAKVIPNNIVQTIEEF